MKATAANEHERPQVAELVARLQGVTGGAADAASGIRLGVVEHAGVERGFVLSPRRWAVGRTFARLGRFRRPARDYEWLAKALAGWHWLAFLTVPLPRLGFQSAYLALGSESRSRP